MSGVALAAGASLWLAVVGGLAWTARPRSGPIDRLAVNEDRSGEVSWRRPLGQRWRRLTARLGGTIRRMARRPASEALDRRLGAALFAAVTSVPLDLRLAMIVGLVVQRRYQLVLQELPEVVDLLSVAVRGGLTVPLAVAAVGERLDGEVAAALHQCVEEASLGQRLSDRLEVLPNQLGDATRPLMRALIAADRYGVPIGDPLERVAADVRTVRRRNAEIAARRVPIKLLFPLVFCVLPSFALLTVVPVLAGSLESLRL